MTCKDGRGHYCFTPYDYRVLYEDEVCRYDLFVDVAFFTSETLVLEAIPFEIGNTSWSAEINLCPEQTLWVFLVSRNHRPIEAFCNFTLVNRLDAKASLSDSRVDKINPKDSCGFPFGIESAKEFMKLSNGFVKDNKFHVRIEFRIRNPNNETHSILTNGRCLDYTWNLKHLSMCIPPRLESEAFEINDTQWKLTLSCPHPSTKPCNMKVGLVSLNEDVQSVIFAAAVLDTHSERFKTDKMLKGCFEFRRKNSSRHHEISLERILSHGKYGIAKDAWTAFRIHVILQPKQNAIPALPVFTALDSNRVYIELTVDDYIKEKPFTTESNHFHLPSRRVDMASEKEPLSAIVDQIRLQLGGYAYETRLWMCMNNRNDFYSIGQCVDYLPLEQMTVGEVCRRPKDDHPSVLFYVEKEETNDLPHLSPNLIIVLLKYLDPFAESIEFVTHIAIDVTSTCQSLLENVAECLEGKGKCHPVTLYLETGQEQVQQIEPTSKTLSSTGLQSGSWIVARRDTNGRASTDQIVGEMVRCRDPIDPKVQEPECCCCLLKPPTWGLVHGDQCHKCVCEECAQLLLAQDCACPICRTPIERAVRIY